LSFSDPTGLGGAERSTALLTAALPPAVFFIKKANLVAGRLKKVHTLKSAAAAGSSSSRQDFIRIPSAGGCQKGAGSRDCTGEVSPNPTPPPPEPKGLPEGAQREPANGTPETQAQRNRQELKNRYGQPLTSIWIPAPSGKRGVNPGAQALCRRVRNDLGYCTKCVPWLAMTIWYLQRRQRWPMSGIRTFPPELKSPLPIMQMEHTRSCSSTCVGYEHAH
jgi:hypothetical protein